MAEYIEREALLKVLRGSAVAKYPSSFALGLFAAANEAEQLPAADVEPVVRCKDCKHRRDYGMCDHPKAVGWDAIAPEDDDFCSYGERRSE